MLELYRNIKDKRITLGMTQTELAQKTGYNNKSSIASIESGKVDLPLSKIHALAKALNCTASELMGDMDEKNTYDAKETTPQLLELIKVAESLDDYFLEKLLIYSKKLQDTQNELNR